jgi:hypothetical protein
MHGDADFGMSACKHLGPSHRCGENCEQRCQYNERDDVGGGHETSPFQEKLILTVRGPGCLELDQKDLRPNLYDLTLSALGEVIL